MDSVAAPTYIPDLTPSDFLIVWPFGRQPVRTRHRRMLYADDLRGIRVNFTRQECMLLFSGGRRLKMGTILKNNCAFSNVILNSTKFLCF